MIAIAIYFPFPSLFGNILNHLKNIHLNIL